MRILVDLDGVVADFTKRWVEIANYRHNLGMAPEDITEWEMYKCTGGRLTKEQANKIFEEAGFFRHLHAIDGAIDALNHLHEEGHEIFFVTACKRGFEDKEEWLAEHLAFRPQMVFTWFKHIVDGDVLIDDKVSNLLEWEAEHKRGLALCFNQPYNQDYTGPRASDWENVVSRIDNFDALRLMTQVRVNHGLPA